MTVLCNQSCALLGYSIGGILLAYAMTSKLGNARDVPRGRSSGSVGAWTDNDDRVKKKKVLYETYVEPCASPIPHLLSQNIPPTLSINDKQQPCAGAARKVLCPKPEVQPRRRHTEGGL
jgi:hypothetical protein